MTIFDSMLSFLPYLTEAFLAATHDTYVHLSFAGWVVDGGRVMQVYL